MGDFHFDLLDIDTDYRKKFDRMREMVADDLLLRGWSQIVDEPTRSVKGRNKTLLHHIFVNNIDYVDGHHNRNVITTDHNMIGVTMSTSESVFQRRIFKVRKIDEVDKEDFNYSVLQLIR